MFFNLCGSSSNSFNKLFNTSVFLKPNSLPLPFSSNSFACQYGVDKQAAPAPMA
jgi:hypothetical protein